MKIPIITPLIEKLLGIDYLRNEREEFHRSVSESINRYDNEIKDQTQRFYTALQDLRNHNEGKPTIDLQEHSEYWINDSSRMINFYLNQKKTFLSFIDSKDPPLESSRFSDLMYHLKEASEIVKTKDITENLIERRDDLIDNIGIDYFY